MKVSPYNNIQLEPERLRAQWGDLCARFLPVKSHGSTWRYSRESAAGDPVQGWKIHLSANLLTACDVLQRVAPYLQRTGALFKAPDSLEDVQRINCGLSHGFSQIGKIITIYPQTDEIAVAIARRLHRLTSGLEAPTVPFDLHFRPGSCVYYRYGAFDSLKMETPDGKSAPAMRRPDGRLVPDRREAGCAKPDWVSDPLANRKIARAAKSEDTPLKTSFRAFQALSRRGKGGVYQAIDLSGPTPRLCILKEGRRGGEINWDGRDGRRRLQNEERVLGSLSAVGVAAPAVIAAFEVEGNYYLATEYLDGENLQTALLKRRKRLSISQTIRYGIQIATIVSGIHHAGWVWRDCKPSNLILMKTGALRPIDFEGACPIDDPDPWPWNTREFSPPDHLDICPGRSRLPEDLYAIGATLYFLLTGRLLTEPAPSSIGKIRRNVPLELCGLISELLDSDPNRRLPADEIIARLRQTLASIHSPQIGRRAHRTSSRNFGSDRWSSKNGSINKKGNVANRSLQDSCKSWNA